MNIFCVIPARGGSKGLKNKNIKPFLGRPLLYYTIKAAQESRLIDTIAVSTDCPRIARVARSCGVPVIPRPKEYATDHAPIELALQHAVEYVRATRGYKPDIVVWLQPNLPLRKKGQIDAVLKQMIQKHADAAATVYAVDRFPQWMKLMDAHGFLTPFMPVAVEYRRQDMPPLYLLDGAVIAMKTQALANSVGEKGPHKYLGKKTVGVVQDKRYSVEIDDPESFRLAEFYSRVLKNKGRSW